MTYFGLTDWYNFSLGAASHLVGYSATLNLLLTGIECKNKNLSKNGSRPVYIMSCVDSALVGAGRPFLVEPKEQMLGVKMHCGWSFSSNLPHYAWIGWALVD